MNVKNIVSATAIATLLVAGIASAQTSPSVTISSSPNTSAITPGSQNAALGTFTVTGPVGNSQITSIPFVLSTANGGATSTLSNCVVTNNATGQTINTAVNTVQGGSNAFVLSSPLTITGGTATTLTLRCNVASNATAGGTFQFVAGIPTYGQSLMTTLAVAPSVNVGAQNAVVGTITLDASRSSTAVRVPSLPISLSGTAGNLQSCSVRNVNALGTSLNTGSNAITLLGSGNVTFDSPVVVPAGGAVTLAVVCNVNASAPVGSSFVLGLTPSAVAATDPATGNTITPVSGFNVNGGSLPTSGTLVLASVDSGTPGLPNTGAGGDSTMNISLLAISGLIALFGLSYLAYRVRMQ